MDGQRPLDFLIPKFIELSDHENSKVRVNALSALSHFVPIGTQSLYANIDNYIACLFRRASDANSDVRRHVCSSLVMILASRPDRLIPEMNNVAEFMLYSTRDQDPSVALEACEFWLTFAEEPELQSQLHPLLPRLAPVLLQCMVYSEDDLIWLGGDDEDTHQPDKASDIKPKQFGAKAHGFEHTGENNDPSTHKSRGALEAQEDDDDFDPDFEDEEDLSTEWNLRKCAAAALDVIAVQFGADLLQTLLPHLREKLWSSEWLQKESGILALGAMAEGCIDVLEPHLPVLVPFLIDTLNDPKPLVRSITCWTLGRYASWCTQIASEEHRARFFVPAMEGLLRMVLDNNKRVQEAGCSAFATLEEEAGPELAPFLEPILRNLVFAFEKYQQKNLLILYDAVGTLADAVGSALDNKAYIDILMPPLTERWAKLEDDNEDLIPLLECLSSVTMAAGKGFATHAEPVFERCVRIVRSILMQFEKYRHNPNAIDEPDKTFLVVSLDLLSGLTQGLGNDIDPLYLRSDILDLLCHCISYPEAPVRQSAYALVGDLAITCPNILRPFIPRIMPELITQIQPEPKFEFISACNNATWSVGEVALHFGNESEFQQWIPALVNQLIPILLNPKTPKSLSENAAVTIGRVSLVQPHAVAPHLDHFAQQWCQALWEIKDNEEKDSAFRGFCALIEANPGGIQRHFLWFCNAVVKWQTPSQELNELFRRILTGFKQLLGAQWDSQMAGMPPQIQERLRQRYQL
jgi:transportin-1